MAASNNYSGGNFTDPLDPLPGAVSPSLFTQLLMCLFYGTLAFTAVTSNTIVCYIVLSNSRMRTATNYFIVNLAVGDILMALLCIPFTFPANLIFQYWPFGFTLCVIVSYSQSVSVFVSAYTMVAISIDKYMAINYPMRLRLPKLQAKIIILAIWAAALLTSLPSALLSSLAPLADVAPPPSDPMQPAAAAASPHPATANSTSASTSASKTAQMEPPLATIGEMSLGSQPTKYVCQESWSFWPPGQYYYSMALMILQYVLPLFVLVITYSRIVIIVWGKRTPGEEDNARDARMARSKRKMIKMVMLCVIAFALTWLPFNALIVIGDIKPAIWEHRNIMLIWFFTHFLAMCHTITNPLIYIWMNNRFRAGFKQVIGDLCGATRRLLAYLWFHCCCLGCLLDGPRQRYRQHRLASSSRREQRWRPPLGAPDTTSAAAAATNCQAAATSQATHRNGRQLAKQATQASITVGGEVGPPKPTNGISGGGNVNLSAPGEDHSSSSSNNNDNDEKQQQTEAAQKGKLATAVRRQRRHQRRRSQTHAINIQLVSREWRTGGHQLARARQVDMRWPSSDQSTATNSLATNATCVSLSPRRRPSLGHQQQVTSLNGKSSDVKRPTTKRPPVMRAATLGSQERRLSNDEDEEEGGTDEDVCEREAFRSRSRSRSRSQSHSKNGKNGGCDGSREQLGASFKRSLNNGINDDDDLESEFGDPGQGGAQVFEMGPLMGADAACRTKRSSTRGHHCRRRPSRRLSGQLRLLRRLFHSANDDLHQHHQHAPSNGVGPSRRLLNARLLASLVSSIPRGLHASGSATTTTTTTALVPNQSSSSSSSCESDDDEGDKGSQAANQSSSMNHQRRRTGASLRQAASSAHLAPVGGGAHMEGRQASSMLELESDAPAAAATITKAGLVRQSPTVYLINRAANAAGD